MGTPAQYAPGQQLPGTVYRVVRHLATGGMGSVYDVEDITVGKRYVLKTLHPQLVSRHDLAKRMEVEARTLAKLQHPNIVDVVTAGLTTDEPPMPFYVMERLNGQNLRVVLEKKGSLELAHCFRIAIDVLDALEHAHENSVIHRDVKPENIFLHRNANGTTITKLLDFGIIRLLDSKASHTQGKFIGTLRYASPEQIFGGELGTPTDIYSLGIVLYEMLAGRGPFDEIGDAYAIGAAHAQKAPPPLSQFVAVSVPLERLVMSSLAKRPEERPRDCFSFASDLRRMLRDEEAAPKSATAINVLSSAPPNTSASLPHASTEASAPVTEPTELGMPVPSAAGAVSAVSAAGFASGVATPRASVDLAMGPATALGVAATMASEPGVRPKPAIDRSAETRASGVSGSTQRLAQNGTSMEDLGPAGSPPLGPDRGPALLADDAVRAALAQRQPLEVPPTSGHPQEGRGDIVFPVGHGLPSSTGPLAGEASTRPPERGLLLPLVAAALVGALLVGGALLAVIKPWHAKVVTAGPPAATTAPSAAPAISTVAPAASTATITPASASALPSGVAAIVPIVPVTPASTGPAAPTRTTPAPRTRPDAAPAPSPATPRRPPRGPPGAAPRPEDVGFE